MGLVAEQTTAFFYPAMWLAKKALEGRTFSTVDVDSSMGFSTSETTYQTMLNLSGRWLCGLCQIDPDETDNGGLKATIDSTVTIEQATGMNDRDCIIGPGANWNGTDWEPAWVCAAFVVSETSLLLQCKSQYGSAVGARAVAVEVEE